MIKRLHLFVLKSFLPLFAMTFFIVLFIVLMQFLWRYIDDLVGKGLSMSLIGELFFYAAVSMVPMALPLAILLASLMTFGNFGERFELTAMKAAGISLVKVMAPLIVLISGVAVGAFFFQNDVLPKAQVKMWTLLFSMRQKNPEVEIPVGVFYDQIPGINLHVGEKNRETGMLYDVKIYDVRRGGENVTILVSDSARMALTKDMNYIYLHLFKGQQYERMAGTSGLQNDPFRRESYDTKEILIPFDNNFNRMDEGGMKSQYIGKNLTELQHSIDSMNHRIDSLGVINSRTVASQISARQSDRNYSPYYQAPEQKAAVKVEKEPEIITVSFDSVINSMSTQEFNTTLTAAIRNADQHKSSITFEAQLVDQEKKIMRRHAIELLKKFTLSIACIIFFFIGAPLGAIIRKGGIGMPLVISVLLFLVYYIFDNAGYKMARDGHAEVWFGIWLSTFVMAPLGIFVTYKAMNDSSVFDPDRIKLAFNRLIGRQEIRTVALKEVVINDIYVPTAVEMLEKLAEDTASLQKKLKKKFLFLGARLLPEAKALSEEIDNVADYLSNSRSIKVIDAVNRLPVISPTSLSPIRRLKRSLTKTETTTNILLKYFNNSDVI